MVWCAVGAMLQHKHITCAVTIRSGAPVVAVWLLQSLSPPDPSASKHRQTRRLASFRATAFSTALLRYGKTVSPKSQPDIASFVARLQS